MFGVFLKLLIFHVMIAHAIKHWLQAQYVLVKKKISITGSVCACACEYVCYVAAWLYISSFAGKILISPQRSLPVV